MSEDFLGQRFKSLKGTTGADETKLLLLPMCVWQKHDFRGRLRIVRGFFLCLCLFGIYCQHKTNKTTLDTVTRHVHMIKINPVILIISTHVPACYHVDR